MQTPLTRDPEEAARVIANGGLAAFATETVYGLGANALSDKAVAGVFAVKQRPRFNPLIVHLASAEHAFETGLFNEVAAKLAQAFWPGPLTLVVPRPQASGISLLASAGLPSLAIRVPALPLAREMLMAARVPVVAPSANASGRISPTTASHVAASLPRGIDLIPDGGACQIGVESTVVSCLEDDPALLRPGGISAEDIEAVLQRPLIRNGAHIVDPHMDRASANTPVNSTFKAPVAPGQLASHYAPRAVLRCNATSAAADEALVTFGPGPDTRAGLMRHLSPSGDLAEAAANLFRVLHELDAEGVEKIAVMPIPDQGLGKAINDRLERAAAPR